MFERIPNSIVTSNGKGSVGKTTVASNLAYEASRRGLQVLVVDFDHQANPTAVTAREATSAVRRRRAATQARYSLKMPDVQKRLIEITAARTGRSQNDVIVLCIKSAIDDGYIPEILDF